MNNQFCHLHSHSAYSLLDGLCNLSDLVSRAKELNQPAIALTEHGNMHSAFNFYKECKKQNIKPVIGIETYLAKNRMQDKEEDDRQRYHFLLLAENQTGYKNLIQLSSLAYTEGFYYKPRIDNELLAQHSDGLIATSGCMASPVAQAYFENPQKAIQLINFYSDIFADRFFLELQEHSIPELTEYNRFLIEQSKKNNLPLLATNDVHYVNNGDSFNHDILLCVQTNKKYQDKNRMRFSDNGYYLKSYDEMFQLFGEYPESLSNSVLISEMCNVNLDFDGYKIPKFQNNIDSFAELWKVAHSGLVNRYKLLQIAKNPAIMTRFEYEMSIIQQMSIADYFLILWDLCKYARSQNIWYNTRGSATGSIVCYALGITSLCPLEHELYFERFLNPSRVNLPDVDLDIEDVQREKIAHYLLEKYGSENIAQIATFSTMKARGTIRDVFRAMDVPLSQADIVAKSIPQIPGKVITINSVLDGESEFYSPEFNSHYQNYQKEIDIAKGLESTVRHSGIHAAGVVVTPSPVTDYAPIMRNTNGLGGIQTATQWDMKTIDEIGLLKIDLLGLTTLSAIRECSQLIQQRYNIRCRYDDIPFESFHKPLLTDKPVSKAFQLLAQGKTVGCFQLENAGLQNVLKQMKPTEFRHIVAAISLYRPGPKQFIPEYIAGLHGYKRNSKYEVLEDILGKTYYSLVYQEQIISIARKIANYSAHEADYIRKAIGKRNPPLMASHKEKFINGGLQNGYEKHFLEELWQDIEKFAAYSFNKCVSGDTKIIDADTGLLVSVSDIYSNKVPTSKTVSYDEKTLTPVIQSIRNVYKNGKKQVYELTTKNRKKIKATENHPLLTVDGWKNLGDLLVGDMIAVSCHTKLDFEEYNIEDYKIITLGYIISEGNTCHPSSIYFFNNSSVIVNDYVSHAQNFYNTDFTFGGKAGSKTITVQSKRIRVKEKAEIYDFFKENDLTYKTATQKFLPDFVFMFSNRQIALLLGRMWTGDGHVSKSGIFYATSSFRLAKDVSNLLDRLGITNKLAEKNFKYRGGIKVGYTVHVYGSLSTSNFRNTIGKYIVGKKLIDEVDYKQKKDSNYDVVPFEIRNRIRKLIFDSPYTFNEVSRVSGVSLRRFSSVNGHDSWRSVGFRKDTILGLAKFFNGDYLFAVAGGSLLWEEITNIKPLGEEETYDIEMDGWHNFVANGIIVHNSHGSSYATLSVKTAYLKANFPLEFMVSCINSESSKPDRQKDYLFETLRLGIKLLPPDVNYSTNEFQIENDAIRFGYSAIKYAKSTEEIIANRPYESFDDFCNKVNAKKVGKKTMCALLCSGAFDSIIDRNKALQIVENYTQWQKGRFNFVETIYSQKQIEKFELEYMPIVLNKNYTFLDNYNDGDFIVLTGVVQSLDIILTKYGKKFVKFVLDNVECLMYNTDNLGTLESGQVVARGKVRHDVHGSSVVVDNVLATGNKVKKGILL